MTLKWVLLVSVKNGDTINANLTKKKELRNKKKNAKNKWLEESKTRGVIRVVVVEIIITLETPEGIKEEVTKEILEMTRISQEIMKEEEEEEGEAETEASTIEDEHYLN